MRIVAHRPQSWFLAEDDGRLFLDVNGNSGIAGFSVLMAPTDEERAAWAEGGESALDGIADKTQNAGPSIVAQRDVGEPWRSFFHDTVAHWLAEQRAAIAASRTSS